MVLCNGMINIPHTYWSTIATSGKGYSLMEATNIAIDYFYKTLEKNYPDANGALNVSITTTSNYNSEDFCTIYDVLVYGNPFKYS